MLIVLTRAFPLLSVLPQLSVTLLALTAHSKARSTSAASPAKSHGKHWGADGAGAVVGGTAIQQTQVGLYHTRQGHGFAAEDINARHDRSNGCRVEEVGKSRTLNGADRISNGVPIQTKYCRTASASFKAAFDAKGIYKYQGQVLEVPRGQYDEVVALMAKAIEEGRVPGVADPSKAASHVREGKASWWQARRVARAGNLDSVLFDIRVHAPGAVLAAGIAFVEEASNGAGDREDFAEDGGQRQRRPDWRRAGAESLKQGLKSLAGNAITSQLVRSRIARRMTATARICIRKAAGTSGGKKLINSIATVACGKTVRGAAAVNHVSRLMRSSFIAGGVSVALTVAPDVGRAMIGRKSWGQVGRNGVEAAASTGAGMAAWTLCYTGAALAGATVMSGGAVLVVAFAAGTIGSIAAGHGASLAARAGMTALLGEENVLKVDATAPKWFAALLVESSATSRECALLTETFGAQFTRYRRFDRPRGDVEALAQARNLVREHLLKHRAAPLAVE